MNWLNGLRSLFSRKPAPEPPPDENQDIPHQLLAELNRYRRSIHLPECTLDSELCKQAQYHSIIQAQMGICSHFSTHGTNVLTRVFLAGYHHPIVICENIAQDYVTAKSVIKAWYCSRPHRANMLDKHCHYLGVGIEVMGGKRFWTMILVGNHSDTTLVSLAGPLCRPHGKYSLLL